MEIKPKCYKCGTSDGILASIFAAGQYYMCNDCIEAEEEATGKVAIFSGLKGLEFVDREKAEYLLNRNVQGSK